MLVYRMITGFSDKRFKSMSVSSLEKYEMGIIKRNIHMSSISSADEGNSIRDLTRKRTGIYFFLFSEDAQELGKYRGYKESFYKTTLRPTITEYDIDIELLAANIALGIYNPYIKRFALEFALLEEELSRYLDSNGKHTCITGRLGEIPYDKNNDSPSNAQILRDMQRETYDNFKREVLPEVKKLIGAHINYGDDGFYPPYSEPYPVEKGIELLKRLDIRK